MLTERDDQPALAHHITDVARALNGAASFPGTLERVVELACDTVPGCEVAALSIQSGGAPEAPVGTDDRAVLADRRQHELAEGPGIEALRTAYVVHVEDLAADGRWPLFSPAAAELGLRSALCCRLSVPRDEETLGVLSLYSSRSGAFDVTARDTALLFAAHAALALAGAEHELRAAMRESNLEQALVSRDVIGQAKGILMEREHIGADEAFERLRRISQHENRKLRVIAEELANGNGSSSNGSSSNGSSSNGSSPNGSEPAAS